MKNTIIMGAAGRDFHNFLVYFKEHPIYRVVCFTAEQIPGIANRTFPSKLAGARYPKGIPVFPESELESLIKNLDVDTVCLSYSDLSHEEVMHKASLVLSCGANFLLLGAKDTQLKSRVPVVAVTAVRTGAGKSPISRKIGEFLRDKGLRVIAVRHPMPYGNLEEQEVQCFADYGNLESAECTIEECEEYEPWIGLGIPIYSGIDYRKILQAAQEEADVIIWDGGNNDMPFYKPDLHIVVADSLRPGHEISYHPGESNLRAADIIVINKADIAPKECVGIVRSNIKNTNKRAIVVLGMLAVKCEKTNLLKNKKVLIVGDGPTLTHGNMSFGAGTILARKLDCKIIEPGICAQGSLRKALKQYPHLQYSTEVPAMGYSKQQIKDLRDTINKSKADVIIDATPVNLSRILDSKIRIVSVDYAFEEIKTNKIEESLDKLILGKMRTNKEIIVNHAKC